MNPGDAVTVPYKGEDVNGVIESIQSNGNIDVRISHKGCAVHGRIITFAPHEVLDAAGKPAGPVPEAPQPVPASEQLPDGVTHSQRSKDAFEISMQVILESRQAVKLARDAAEADAAAIAALRVQTEAGSQAMKKLLSEAVADVLAISEAKATAVTAPAAPSDAADIGGAAIT